VAESDASGHADRAWACFLACHAAAGPVVRIEHLTPRDLGGELAPRPESLRRALDDDRIFRTQVREVDL
jgi:hypothetical protein